jgi:hypothetical protein
MEDTVRGITSHELPKFWGIQFFILNPTIFEIAKLSYSSHKSPTKTQTQNSKFPLFAVSFSGGLCAPWLGVML